MKQILRELGTEARKIMVHLILHWLWIVLKHHYNTSTNCNFNEVSLPKSQVRQSSIAERTYNHYLFISGVRSLYLKGKCDSKVGGKESRVVERRAWGELRLQVKILLPVSDS